MSRIAIRPEQPGDRDAVRRIHEAAFGQPDEARIVERLRASPGCLSLVAAAGAVPVGHLLLTPVRIEGAAGGPTTMGLGPMAVLPEHQRQGIGSQLVHAAIEECRRAGHALLLVVGHPAYYPRFGFVPAATLGLRFEREVAREAFLALELGERALPRLGGTVRFPPEFWQT